MSFERMISGARVLVCLGPGGVGKTTTAAAIATSAAMQGRRVAVLTVDPAARLKDALELPPKPGTFHRVPLPASATGTLDALLLDAKGLFDDLVRRLSPSPDVAESVLGNPVYKNIAGAFAGSDAYMALEQLLDVAEADRFDLIVVDTPPASHAIELFDAPERILALLNSKALEYLSEPVRILGIATSALTKGLLAGVLTALERMTGLSLLSDVSSLAQDFSAVSPMFRRRAEQIRALLHAPDTRYMLVAAPDPHGARDTISFAAEVQRAGVRHHGVVVNRVFEVPPLSEPNRPTSGAAAPPKPEWPRTLARKMVSCAHDLDELRGAQRALIADLRRGLEDISGADEVHWFELPALFPAPISLDAIGRLAETLSRENLASTTAA